MGGSRSSRMGLFHLLLIDLLTAGVCITFSISFVLPSSMVAKIPSVKCVLHLLWGWVHGGAVEVDVIWVQAPYQVLCRYDSDPLVVHDLLGAGVKSYY